MTSTKFYKQSVFDHASISIAVLSEDDDEKLTSKVKQKLIDYIFKTFESLNVTEPNNNLSDNEGRRKIFFNFKRNFSPKEREWENFQCHHKPLGFLFFTEFKKGNDLRRIIDWYVSEKDRLSSSIFESRLIFVCDESAEAVYRNLKLTISASAVEDEIDEVLSFVDSETGENILLEKKCDDRIDEDVALIQESFIQNEIIWYRQPLNTSPQMVISSSNSIDELSNSSPRFSLVKMNSITSDNNQYLSNANSPSKSIENSNSLTVPAFDRELGEFLKIISEKLSLSLASRKNTLANKIEQTKSKSPQPANEANSDTGSILSLDDGEFNLSDPVDQDGIRKSTKSRQYLGRLYKQAADYSLLCGNPFEAYHYYQLAICYLKKHNSDQLWLAGAEEGLCCAWIVYNFPSSSATFDQSRTLTLHEKTRLLLANQTKSDSPAGSSAFLSLNNSLILSQTNVQTDQTDFAPFFKKTFAMFNDTFRQNPPEIHNLNDLYEKYHSSISRYKKALKTTKFPATTIYPINLDSIIKVSRFFVDQHRFLDASNFLKMLKTDLLPIQNDLEQYHDTLGQLYGQMGFFRKAALHKYKKLLIIDSKMSSINTATTTASRQRKVAVLTEILTDLKLDDVGTLLLHNGDRSINNDANRISVIPINRGGCQSIKLELFLELFHETRCLNYPRDTVLTLGLSILDNWFNDIPQNQWERLLGELNNLVKYHGNKSIGRPINAQIRNLPRLKSVILTKLPDYLLPKQSSAKATANGNYDHDNMKSVFLYTPLKADHRHSSPAPSVTWICGEECEVVLKFDNLTPLPLQLADVMFLVTNVDTQTQISIPSEGSSIHYLQAHNRNIHCHFVIVPDPRNVPVGNYRITDVSYHLGSISNIKFHPHTTISDSVFQRPDSQVPRIKLCPAMPSLRIISSLNDHLELSDFRTIKAVPETVSKSSLLLYDNEILEFCLFLSNESKDCDIDQLTCCLDELDLNIANRALISRFTDQLYSNRKVSSHKLLSLTTVNLEQSLPIKSLSSLKLLTATTTTNQNPTLPTEAILKFRIDSTDREFCRELFRKSSLNQTSRELQPLWMGQLRISIQYRSNRRSMELDDSSREHVTLSCDIDDAVMVVKHEPDPSTTTITGAEDMFRESVCVINCQLVSGLGLINYHLDNLLNLELTLMNFTENKMNVEIFWKKSKVHNNYIVIASGSDKSEKIKKLSNSKPPYHRNSSTELFPQIYSMSIPDEKLQLKSLMKNGSITSQEELAGFIQSNLQISWFMKDKSLDKIRQGNVNLSWCNCGLSRIFCQDIQIDNATPVGHELSFSIYDIVRIWMWDNVHLELIILSDDDKHRVDDEDDSDVDGSSGIESKPALPDNVSGTINLYGGIAYRMICKFKDSWPSFLSSDILYNIRLLPCIVTNKVSINSASYSSDFEDKTPWERFVFAGNTILNLSDESIPAAEANGYLMFLVPGSYSVSCQLTVSNTDFHQWQSDVTILAESNTHLIYVV